MSQSLSEVSEERIGVRNGVDTVALFETLNHVKSQPELAKFRFQATNRWVSGTHSQSTIDAFYGAGAEQHHVQPTVLDVDHPRQLVGQDEGPSPIEYLLHVLAGCLTAGIGNIASARGVKLNSVESTVEGDMDLLGVLGLSDEVRNGFNDIRVSFRIDADADDEVIRNIVERSRARSAAFDVMTNGVPISIEVETV